MLSFVIVAAMAGAFFGCAGENDNNESASERDGLDGKDKDGKSDKVILASCKKPSDCAADEYCDQVCLMYCSVDDPDCCEEGVCRPSGEPTDPEDCAEKFCFDWCSVDDPGCCFCVGEDTDADTDPEDCAEKFCFDWCSVDDPGCCFCVGEDTDTDTDADPEDCVKFCFDWCSVDDPGCCQCVEVPGETICDGEHPCPDGLDCQQYCYAYCQPEDPGCCPPGICVAG